ncbi:hypothetical protein N658DRAFT_224452 [Parathielavia hyrcaniae]|uniref:Uncharacterized protein n=1 Tax=Parathielavia hyrcaniae TaxID=113614 RepID=A0AAN6SYQ5_9PEZI|nr:hypothetical protein N658DRAFT_224452 [Parathielavia hyrcaniae]
MQCPRCPQQRPVVGSGLAPKVESQLEGCGSGEAVQRYDTSFAWQLDETYQLVRLLTDADFRFPPFLPEPCDATPGKPRRLIFLPYLIPQPNLFLQSSFLISLFSPLTPANASPLVFRLLSFPLFPLHPRFPLIPLLLFSPTLPFLSIFSGPCPPSPFSNFDQHCSLGHDCPASSDRRCGSRFS